MYTGVVCFSCENTDSDLVGVGLMFCIVTVSRDHQSCWSVSLQSKATEKQEEQQVLSLHLVAQEDATENLPW